MSITLAVLEAGRNTDDSTWPSGLAGLSAEALPGSMKATAIIPPTTKPAKIWVLLWMIPWMLFCTFMITASILLLFPFCPCVACSAIWMYIAVFMVPHLEICCEVIVGGGGGQHMGEAPHL